jgi:site-specific recombinase XerD
MIDVVEPAPVAFSKTEWNVVRGCAEQLVRRDHGLAFALAILFRYAGPRDSEVAALQTPDMFRSQHGSVCSPFAVIRRGKGLKHREIPLIQEAHELLDTYLKHREHLAKRWRERVTAHGEASWSRWPDGHLFLGQRGLLTERGIREIIAKSLSTVCHHQELKRVTSEARNSHHTHRQGPGPTSRKEECHPSATQHLVN